MNVLHLLTLALLLASASLALGTLVRTGDTRVLLLVALFALLGVPPAIGLWTQWDHPLGLDPPTGSAAASFAAALLGLASVALLRRTLLDLDRTEGLHWNSMESVRHLSEIAALRASSLEERLPRLLQVGCERLGLEIGYVSRVIDGRCEVLAIHAPADFPVAAGACFALEDTPCGPTLTSPRPVALERGGDPASPLAAAHEALRFETYLGAAVRNGETASGTLVFAGRRARRERLTATHKDLVQLMAQWIGLEFERGVLQEHVASAPAAPSGRKRHPGRSAGLELDALLRRARRRLRAVLPAGVEVELRSAPDLPVVPTPGAPVEAILLSLARRAAAAMPSGGILELGAAAAPAGPEGAKPAHVTLFVTEPSGGVDPEVLAAPGADPAAGAAGAEHDDAIPLLAIQRMLRSAGGDLSIEVEPGRRSRFTVYLPLEAPTAVRPRPAPRPGSPAPVEDLVPAAPPGT